MSESKPLKYTFPKSERLHSKKLIQELFDKGSSFYLYPFKVIYLRTEDVANHQLLVSVSKRKFKNAVTRNLLKRRIKEAYRLHKSLLFEANEPSGNLLIAYIYTGKEVSPYQLIERKLKKTIARLLSELESDQEHL